MARLSFGAWAGAAYQGEQLNAALDQKKAETESIKTDQQYKQMQMMALQTKQKQEADIGQWLSATAQAENAPGATAEDQIKLYQKGSQELGAQGNFTGMEMMNNLAKEKLDELKTVRVEHAAEDQVKKEALADAATSYVASPSMQGQIELAKKAVAAGINPAAIPPPGQPGSQAGLDFMAWVKNQQTASMTGKEKLAFIEKQKEFDASFAEKKQSHEDALEIRRTAQATTAAIQTGNMELRKESLLLRGEMVKAAQADKADRKTQAANNADFNQTEKLNGKLQQAASPMLKDRSVIQEAKGLLMGDSAASDQQLHQILPSLLGQLKGRATNAYYKDNKNFGNVEERFEGLISHTMTGRFSEEQRKQIYQMMDQLQTGVIDPALRNLESDQKKHATRYGLDPDNVEIQGDFNREGNRGVTGSWGGTPTKPSAQTSGSSVIPDGTIAKNPNGGPALVRKNGKWVPQ